MASFELWDERTNQPIGRWATKSLALQAVRDLLEVDDIIAVAALVLRETDWGSPSVTIAGGSQLVALARIGTGEEWTRSRRPSASPRHSVESETSAETTVPT